MPTYEYECTNCGEVFEMVQSITAKRKTMPDEPCRRCGKRAPIRRLIGSGGAVLFKGTGFYETDYRSEGYKQAAKAEKERVSGDGKKSASKGASSKDSAKPGSSKASPADAAVSSTS